MKSGLVHRRSNYRATGYGMSSTAIAAIILLCVTPARGAIIWDINDVTVNYKNPCDAPTKQINLGDLHVSLDFDTGIVSTFTVDPAISGPGSGGTYIWDCLNLHYVQLITADDCPASVAGVKAGSPGFPFPVIDTPPNGWDYIYKDKDNPEDGIQADERVPDNVDGAAQKDDALDTLPWYHTLDEEMGKAGSGFEVVGSFQECVSYVLKDEPGFCEDNGVTSFSTFLVAEPTATCPGLSECLAPGDILLLAGFNWTWASNSIGINIIDVPNAATVETALANTGFTGWNVEDTGTICCAVPEPSSLSIFAVGIALAYRLPKAINSRRNKGRQPLIEA